MKKYQHAFHNEKNINILTIYIEANCSLHRMIKCYKLCIYTTYVEGCNAINFVITQLM